MPGDLSPWRHAQNCLIREKVNSKAELMVADMDLFPDWASSHQATQHKLLKSSLDSVYLFIHREALLEAVGQCLQKSIKRCGNSCLSTSGC